MPRKHRRLYYNAILCVIFTVLALTLPAQRGARPSFAPAPDSENIVELPQYTVTADRILPPPESWHYCALPGYEILSDASARATRRFLSEFQQFQVAIQTVWPALFNIRPSVPTLVVICGRSNSFRAFQPLQKETAIYITPTSVFVEDPERGAIVVDFAATEMLASIAEINSPGADSLSGDFGDGGIVEPTVALPDGSTVTADPYRQFYQQYARFMMRRLNNNKELPEWLDAGLSQLIASMDFSQKYIEFGRMDDTVAALAIRARRPMDTSGMVNLQRMEAPNVPIGGVRSSGGASVGGGAPMPPSYLFGGPKVEPKQFYGGLMPVGEMLVSTDLRKRSIRWNQQCYAFVHMCLYGNKNKYQKAFIQYVARACAGPVDEKDFKECFGRTYKQITLDLRLYIEGHAHTYTLYKDKKGGTLIPKPPPVELRDATQAEIGRIKGEVFRLGTHYEESRNALIIPYIRRERDAGLLASLGLLENTEGRSARARKFLEAASREKVMRPRAYVELARLRLNEALAEPKGGNNKLAPSQVVSVLDPLFTARSQPPPMAEVYLTIAEAWSHSAMPPKPAHIDILIEGVRRFPKNVALVCNTAELCMEGGDMDRARALVNLGLRVASDEAGRAQFEMLGRRLPAQPPAASN